MTDSGKNEPMGDVRVLVLDDEEPIRRLMQTVLSSAGCLVETAPDGRTGLQKLLQQDFDVLVVDLKMQEMDGITFLQEAMKIWPWLGVVIITGFADTTAVARANALGVTRILGKPLQIDVLRKNVIEEAQAKRQRVVLSNSSNAERVQYQLDILRRLTETAIASESLVDALRSLSEGLAKTLPCAAVGVLGLEEDEEFILLCSQQPVAQQFLDDMLNEIRGRYEVLSNRTLKMDGLRIELDGNPTDETGPRKAGSTFSVPVISSSDFHGLLTLAAVDANAYDTADISFLYHAANHLSTVFAALSRMRQLAIRDSLTGLYNRRHLEEELGRAWLLAERYDHSMCVAIIDLDQFKQINDTYGHPVADQALREFAVLLQEVARASDIIARYGGDELVVVLPQAEREEGRKFADRLLRRVRSNVFCQPSQPLSITVSIGVSDNCNAAHPQGTDDLLAQADRALYAAKKGGRNRVCLWSDIIDRASEDEREYDVDTAMVLLEEAEDRDQKPVNVMVVDDDRAIRTLLKQVLEKEGFRVEVESSAASAIATLAEHRGGFQILVTDLEMPGKTGLELMQEIGRADDSIIKIVVSGHATADNAIACLREGAYDFVEKPLDNRQLTAVVKRAAEYHRLLRENKRYRNYLEDMVNRKSAALGQALEEVKSSYDFTLEAMVAMLDARESTTGQHSLRVRDVAILLAGKLGASEAEIEEIARGALLHDIGKIGTPDAVLLKPGPLNDAEWEIMKRHPDIGYNILRSSPYLREAAEIVLSHQEKYDGTGYPRGLKGNAICLGARIFAVGDAYDAMRSDRVYRKALSTEEALAEIKRCRGTHFDPRVVAAFVACHEEIEEAIGWDRDSDDDRTSTMEIYSRAG